MNIPSSPKTANWLLRIALAVVFLYAAISSFANPEDWIGFLPSLLTAHFPGDTILKLFSIGEIVLAVWLLMGIYTRWAAVACALMLAGIVISNPTLFAISFRDAGLFFAAVALFFVAEE